MYVEFEKFQGYNDQEVLIKALTSFISKRLDQPELHIKAMVNQSLKRWIKETGMSIKEIKDLSTAKRLDVVMKMVDDFIIHIDELIASNDDKDKLKMNILEIYDHWNKTIRKN